MSMNNDRQRSMIIAKGMNIDRYDHWSRWFMHECAVHAMKGYCSYMKNVDHSYERELFMHDNKHIHVIMNIIVTPTWRILLALSTCLRMWAISSALCRRELRHQGERENWTKNLNNIKSCPPQRCLWTSVSHWGGPAQVRRIHKTSRR